MYIISPAGSDTGYIQAECMAMLTQQRGLQQRDCSTRIQEAMGRPWTQGQLVCNVHGGSGIENIPGSSSLRVLGRTIREGSLGPPFDGGGFVAEDEVELIRISGTNPTGFTALST